MLVYITILKLYNRMNNCEMCVCHTERGSSKVERIYNFHF